MPTYQPNIPTGSVPFNQDYANVQGNFQVANTSFGTDHYAFSDATVNNGYHKVIHMIATSTVASNPPNNFPIVPPALVTLSGELFVTQSNVGLAQDEILWWQSGGNKLAQMTVNINPVALTNGYTFIPGGLILQWGVIAAPVSGNNPVLFVTSNIDFPNACFNVQLSLQRAAANVDGVVIKTGTISQTGFTAIAPTAGSANIYWMAIGR